MKSSLIVIQSIIFIIISVLPCNAKIYKWIDDEGVWNFTDDYSRIPERYRDFVKEMESTEEREYEVHFVISKGEEKREIQPPEVREEAKVPEEVTRKAARKAYAPGVGWFVEEVDLGPGDVVSGDIIIYIDGKRFRLINEEGIEADELNFRDRENMKKVYLPKVLGPPWVLYGEKAGKRKQYQIHPQLDRKSGADVMRELMKNRVYRHLY